MKTTNSQFLVLLTLLILALLSLAAQSKPATQDVIRAKVIELVDDAGQVRGQLKVEENGEAVFRLRDATGAIRVKLGASESGSGLVLLDDSTNPGLHALAKKDGTSLTLAGKDGKKRVVQP